MLWIRRIFGGNLPNITLGRWSLKYDEKVINRIVHQANEDHCGCCQMTLDEEYYLPFIAS